MTTPRNDIVRLRLTTLEKQDWAKAAGGSRKLSEWIRSVCNAAAIADRRADLPEGVNPPYEQHMESLGLPVAKPPVPNEKSVMVKDAIERAVSTPPPAVPPPLPKSAQCPRWMHHRSGVYCGSCKRVTT